MAPGPSKDRLKLSAVMSDPRRCGTGRDWRLILACMLALGLVTGGIAYKYVDDLTDFALSLTSGHIGRAQGRIHY
jgi:hypothetical protein